MSDETLVSDSANAYYQAASERCMALLKSLRLTKRLKGVIDDDNVPLAHIDPLPAYSSLDPRASDLQMMEDLHLALRVVYGVIDVLDQLKSPASSSSRIVQWVNARGKAFRRNIIRQALPRAALSAWKGSEEILADLSKFLGHSIYDSQEDLAVRAAWYAAERNPGVILFLALCPNIPLIVPTLEIRLMFTKPLVAITNGMKGVFGRFLLIGLFVSLLSWMAGVLDIIPRLQVRFVQRIVVRRWLGNERKRVDLIGRYLRATRVRVAKPRLDAIVRGLIAIVS